MKKDNCRNTWFIGLCVGCLIGFLVTYGYIVNHYDLRQKVDKNAAQQVENK